VGEYYVGAKSRQILALLKKFGCKITEGGRHYKATAPSGNSVPVPRHKELSNGVVEDICNFLIEEGCDKSLIDRHIKR
jgi:hypothetical protein